MDLGIAATYVHSTTGNTCFTMEGETDLQRPGRYNENVHIANMYVHSLFVYKQQTYVCTDNLMKHMHVTRNTYVYTMAAL